MNVGGEYTSSLLGVEGSQLQGPVPPLPLTRVKTPQYSHTDSLVIQTLAKSLQ